MLRKNYLNSASKTNTCCISKYYFLSFCFSFLRVFFPILPREEKLWQGKKEGKENNIAPQNLTIACSITFFADNFVCFISTAD